MSALPPKADTATIEAERPHLDLSLERLNSRLPCGYSFGDKRGKLMKQIIITTALGLSLSTVTLTAALAADIPVLPSNGVKAAVTELVPQFEKETGHKLHFTWGASNLLASRSTVERPLTSLFSPQR
jgi:hypothetical protein